MNISRLLSLTLGLMIGCADSSEPGATGNLAATDGPENAMDPPADVDVPEPLTCLYAKGERPTAPQYPATDCRREWHQDGELVQYGERSAITVEGQTGSALTVSTADGLARRRTSLVDGPHGRVFEALETLYLSENEPLPYTYGLPGTWSRTYGYDASGNLTDERYDIAMDGTVDWLETLTIDELGGLVERRIYGPAGVLQRKERFGPHGRVLWNGDDLELTGKRYTYDDAGLMTRIESVTAGELVRRDDIEELAPDVMLSQLVVGFLKGEQQFVSRSTWIYHADLWLERFEYDRIVSNEPREERTVYDSDGRELRFTEKNESTDCGFYLREKTYHPAADTLLSSVTTCDGAPFENISVQTDAAGRPTRRDRTWYGTPGKTTLVVDEWAYDTCGAVTRHESVWGDNPPRIQDYTFDDQGRVISQSTTQFDQAPTTVHYAYDTEGRLTQFGDQHYTFDAEGRLSTVTNHNELQFSWPDEDPAADAITFHYECTPAP